MNLRELSELVQVTVHLKNVINSAGYTKFSNDTIKSLKVRMAEFDELFISEVLNYDGRNSSKMIQDAVREAREKMNLDQKYPGPNAPGNALEKLQELTKEATPKESRKPGPRRNVKSVVEEETPKEVEELQENQNIVVKEKEQSKLVVASSKQPYMEDQSLAALLAAEKQKVAAKKRKS